MAGADVDLTVVTMLFHADDVDGLQALLAKYVVVTRGHPGWISAHDLS